MGGTNSGAPLVNNRVMVSYNGEIIESLFQNGTGITISVHDGGIELINDGLLTLTVSAPADLLGVTGSPTVGNAGNIVLTKQPVAANAVYIGPTGGPAADPTFRTLEEADLPPIYAENLLGTLGPLHGGTGNNASFAGDRVVLTDATMMYESTPLFDGFLIIGQTGGPPIPAALTPGSGKMSFFLTA